MHEDKAVAYLLSSSSGDALCASLWTALCVLHLRRPWLLKLLLCAGRGVLLLAGRTTALVKGLHRCFMRCQRMLCLVVASPPVHAKKEAT